MQRQRRVILSPLQPGSRTPEEIRAAVRAVMAAQDDATKALLANAGAGEVVEPQPSRGRLRSVEKRILIPPVTRSVHRAAIRAAVEKVAALREGGKTASTPRQKQALGKNA